MSAHRVPMADRFSAGIDVIDWSDRFWRNVAPEMLSGCWLWTGALRKSDGYGAFNVSREGRSYVAHRYALEQALGRPLGEEKALHRCDNRACCNPSHLRPGTTADNHHDAMNKRRHSHGARHGMAKLNDDDVLAIRAAPESASVLAARYGMSKTMICDIRKGKAWRHLLASAS